MKLRDRRCITLLLAGAVALSGCEAVTELTSEEEVIVTQYAAKVVSKHNVRLGQGLVRYRKPESEIAADEAAVTEEPEDFAVPAEDAAAEGSEGAPEEALEEAAAVAEEAAGAADSGGESSSEDKKSKTLTEAFNLPGIEFKYKENRIYGKLEAANAYVEQPASGNKYVGVVFEATNTAADPQELSIITMKTKFKAKLGGTSKDNKAMTMMLDDLPTYTGTLKPSESRELIVYFEFPEDATTDVSSLTMSADINGTNSRIKL